VHPFLSQNTLFHFNYGLVTALKITISVTFDVSLTLKALFTPEPMSWFSSSGAGGGAPSRLQPALPLLIESRDAEAVVSRPRLDARSIASKPAPVAKSWAHFVAGG
jgi:hypothetical protein